MSSYLHPMLALKMHEWETECAHRGLGVVVTSRRAVRDGGWRQYGLAFCYVPVVDGRFPIEVLGGEGSDSSLWRAAAEVGESVGLTWGGAADPTELRLTFGLTLAQLRKGARIPDSLPTRPVPTPKARTPKAAKVAPKPAGRQTARQKTQRTGRTLRQR